MRMDIQFVRDVAGLTPFQYDQRVKLYNYSILNETAKKDQILFTGSSLMEQFPVVELCKGLNLDREVYNRGIGGYITDEFLAHIDTLLFDLEPSKVFLNIGTNDMKVYEDGTDWLEHILENYRKILDQCRERLPGAEIYLLAFYPVNPVIPQAKPILENMLKVRTKENLALVNRRIGELAASYGYRFIDVNEGLTDEDGNLKEEYTVEGVHMFADAYRVVLGNLRKYL